MNQSLLNILNGVSGLLKIIIPLLITVIVILIIWNALKLARSKEDKDRAEGKKGVISGIIALAIVLSLFGIVRILQNTVFGGGVSNTIQGQGLITPQVIQ